MSDVRSDDVSCFAEQILEILPLTLKWDLMKGKQRGKQALD
jgi:hypothetical protein